MSYSVEYSTAYRGLVTLGIEHTASVQERWSNVTTSLILDEDGNEYAHEPTHVMHVFNEDEVADERAATGDKSDLAEQRGLWAEDGRFVTIRRFVALLSQEYARPKVIDSATAQKYIENLLDDLIARHARNEVHADIRPENAAVRDGSAFLIDGGTRTSWDLLDRYQREYVAPEFWYDKKSRGSKSGDIYSFLRLARALLRPFVGEMEVARLEAAISWLCDAAFVALPKERPSARKLRRALFGRNSIRDGELDDAFLDGFNRALLTLQRSQINPTDASVAVTNRVATHVQHDIGKAPETAVFLNKRTSEHILLWRAIDIPPQKAQYEQARVFRASNQLTAAFRGASTIERLNRPAHIDERWKNRIHHDFYGFGIGPDHEDRLSSLDSASIDEKTDSGYASYLELADGVRAELLDRNSYLSTADVAAHLSVFHVEADSLDVVCMRRWGHVLAVPDHDRWLYPTFQFIPEAGMPSPFIKLMNDARRKGRINAPDDWMTLSLWVQPQHVLGDRAPADLLYSVDDHGLLRRFIRDISRG